jgi:large subunit ribosomal protein L21
LPVDSVNKPAGPEWGWVPGGVRQGDGNSRLNPGLQKRRRELHDSRSWNRLLGSSDDRALRAKERVVYAIFEDGGKQYKVSEGDKLLIELKDLPENQTEITFDKVLMVGEGPDAKIGTPWVEGAHVTATVEEALKMPKVIGIKHRRRKGFVKKWGHRQKMLKVAISAIHG